jgi:hypothetical protein
MTETDKSAAGFFSHPWTSHLPLVGAGTAAQAIRKKFSEASESWPSAVGTVSVARFDAQGKGIKTPHFPWQLIWVETPQLNAEAKKSSSGESVTVYDQIIKVGQNLPMGTPLFDLYVQEVNGSKPVKLGQLLIRSKWFKSTFADRFLFFKHTRVPDDLAARPELNVCPIDTTCKNWCPETDKGCAVWNNLQNRNAPKSSRTPVKRSQLGAPAPKKRIETKRIQTKKIIGNKKNKRGEEAEGNFADYEVIDMDDQEEEENLGEEENEEENEDENQNENETEDAAAAAGCPYSQSRNSKNERRIKHIVRQLEEKIETLESQVKRLEADEEEKW